MASSSPLPSGVSAPLTTDNPNNHSGLIVIITSFYIVLIIVALTARIYASFQRRIMQHDDFLFGVLVVGLCEWIGNLYRSSFHSH